MPETEPSAYPADVTPVWKLARRDTAIVLAALSLWAAADVWYALTGLPLAAVVSVLDGAFVGVGVGLLFHEWGHFAGARLAGGIAPTRKLGSVFPIFDFDLQRSDPAAFRAMGLGGNAAHWSWVLLLLAGIGLDAPGRVALVAGAFGFAVSASFTEWPVIGRAYSGATPVESFAGLTGAKLRRHNWIGFAAGLALFTVL